MQAGNVRSSPSTATSAANTIGPRGASGNAPRVVSAVGRFGVRCFFAVGVFLLGIAPVALARVYKWVDEKGQIHAEGNPPPIEYEWADKAGFFYSRPKVEGKELQHVRPRAATEAAAAAAHGSGGGGSEIDSLVRRVEGLVDKAERQALAFDEASYSPRQAGGASPLDSPWSTWARGFQSEVESVARAVDSASGAPNALGYAVNALRRLGDGGSGQSWAPSRSSRESVIRDAKQSLANARSELAKRAAEKAKPVAPPPAERPSMMDEGMPMMTPPAVVLPVIPGAPMGLIDQTPMKMARMRQALVMVVATGGCEGMSASGSSWTSTTWAQHVVDTQNKEQRASIAEAQQMAPGSMALEPVSFVVGKPKRPWQIAVIPENGNVRVEAYGTDLTKPFQAESVPCAGP